MIVELNNVIFGPLTIVKELAIGMVPTNFKRAINYGWTGLMGLGNWLAYIMACTYFLAEELKFGGDICEMWGYGYWLIDQL